MLLGVILLGILITYNDIGYSLNSTPMFDNNSSLEKFRNIIADTLFQIFGISTYLFPSFLIFCSFEIYTTKQIRFLQYKIVSFFYSVVTIPPIIAIFFNNYDAGVLGLFLSHEIPIFNYFRYIFIILAVISLLFSFSISIKDIIYTQRSLFFICNLIYEKIISYINNNKETEYNHKEEKNKINIMPDFDSLKKEGIKISNKLDFFNKKNSPNENEFSKETYNLESDNFKNSLFYKNIQSMKEIDNNEENYDIYNNEDNHNKVDFNKNFVNDYTGFSSNINPDNEQYKDQDNNLKQQMTQTYKTQNLLDESRIVKKITTNLPVTQQIEEKIPATIIDKNEITIQLSKEDEQISTLKEKKKPYHVPLNFLNIQTQKNNTSTFEIKQNAINLEQIIQEFGINCKVVNIKTGPVVTLYEIAIPAGVKTAKIISLETDIALRMKAVSVRIAVVAGKDVVGIEIPNSNRKTVFLKEILQSKAFKESDAKLPVALGYDINGNAIVADLATMPHLLIAGTTGSGKSVGVNGMILSLLYKLPPEQCKLIMIDPKMLELSVYQDIPHLLTPVVINPKQAISALKWVVKEMENRYYQMSLLAVRNIIGFNQKLENTETIEKIEKDIYDKQGLDLKLKKMPYIVVIIDEMADLMMVAGKEVEMAVQRLAQMARASGIHLIMATQRPSVDVITGTIKANFPTRISFQVSSKIDSRTILGEQGAEQLLGRGDMLYMSGVGRVQRVHGAFVNDNEVSDIVNYLKDLSTPDYIDNITSVSITSYDASNEEEDEKDGLYSQVIEMIHSEGKVSTSFIQRKFQIGYNRAARIVEQLEYDGVISKANSVGKREILIK